MGALQVLGGVVVLPMYEYRSWATDTRGSWDMSATHGALW